MSSVEKEQKGITRREFVKGAAVGGAAGLVVGGAGTALLMPEKKAKPWLPEKWDKEVDVVVVGYGGAGAAAAIEVHDAGFKVLLLEKTAIPGGSTVLSGGIVYGAGTSVQKAAGITDTADEAYEFVMACGRGMNDPELVRIYADNCGPNIEWLEGLGVKWPVERLYVSGAEFQPEYAAITPTKKRGHRTESSGDLLFEPIADVVKARGIEVMWETPASELIADPSSKEVLGVKAESEGKPLYIKARKGVVLASGGFTRNDELLKRYTFEGPIYGCYGTCPGDTGEMILAAMALGADTRNLHNTGAVASPVAPTATIDEFTGRYFRRISIPALPSIYVNKEGKRFINERYHYDCKSIAFVQQTDSVALQVFDEEVALQIAEEDRKDLTKADTIRDLATKIGVDPAGLEDTVNKWNQNAELGKDPEFGVEGPTLGSIRTPPFYAAELKGLMFGTLGGLRIDAKARVIDLLGKVIPRLYAAGRTTGAVIGWLYPASGTAIAEAFTFGRIAGQNAAKEEPWA